MKKSLVPLFLALLALVADAESPASGGVKVSLICETTGVTAGRTFSVGFKIHHLEGYHTYWQNPGIAGVPTALAWTLPEGFSAGPIQWPVPEKTLMAIHPVHGYERDVTLVVDIKAPGRIGTETVKLAADATWMACAKGCNPGKQLLEIELPVTATPVANPATADEFAKARAEIPAPMKNRSVALLSARDSKEIQISLKPPITPLEQISGEIYFFSSDGQVSSDQPQRVERGDDGSLTISLTRSEYSPTGRPSLPGVLKCASPLDAAGRTFAAIDPSYPPQ
jgi:thiol:disulfide interchange protein DsbD